MDSQEAILVLEDGRVFRGTGFGAQGEAFGEVVFNTSMTGYQEIISDPSYCGQIVSFTAPQIGNYGMCPQDDQCKRPFLGGVVVREISPVVSNWRATESMADYLKRFGIVGISEIDTRALTRHLRERGSMRVGIWNPMPQGIDPVEKVRSWPSLVGRDLTSQVSIQGGTSVAAQGEKRFRVVLIDFGVKKGILHSLARRGLEVEVLAADATAAEVLKLQPDGLVLSNGPGDPAAVKAGIKTAKDLLGRLPMLGICLGHQILGLALGASTYKLRFGHHGGNHPVRDEISGEVWITAQNHGFAVDASSLDSQEVKVTHKSLYDGTLEGFASEKLRLLAAQFHPEGCPGPTDAQAIFDRFTALLERDRPHAAP